MRFSVATWNCADGFAHKIPFLDEIDADIITIQELRQSAFELAAPGFKHAFFQKSNTARGIAVFSRLSIPMTHLPMKARKSDQCYLPVTATLPTGDIDILAAWVKPVEDYVRPSQRVLRTFFKASRAPAKLVLGDLNQNRVFDARRRLGLFRKTEAIFAKHRMRSLYHTATGETFGQETRPTHYLTYNVMRPYHLDYIFASDTIRAHSFVLFPEQPWTLERRSDHLPMKAEISVE